MGNSGEYTLIAIVFGDEIFISKSKDLNYLYRRAGDCAYELKCSTGCSYINFYIQSGWRIVDEFSI